MWEHLAEARGGCGRAEAVSGPEFSLRCSWKELRLNKESSLYHTSIIGKRFPLQGREVELRVRLLAFSPSTSLPSPPPWFFLPFCSSHISKRTGVLVKNKNPNVGKLSSQECFVATRTLKRKEMVNKLAITFSHKGTPTTT